MTDNSNAYANLYEKYQGLHERYSEALALIKNSADQEIKLKNEQIKFLKEKQQQLELLLFYKKDIDSE